MLIRKGGKRECWGLSEEGSTQSSPAKHCVLFPGSAAFLGCYPISAVLSIRNTGLGQSSPGKLTRDESKGDRVDTATTTTAIPSRGGLWPLRGADVHLEANGLLEDGGATTGLILSPEAGL